MQHREINPRLYKQETRKTFKKKYKSKNMNKIILSIATVLMMGFSAFATGHDEVANQQTRDAFRKDFISASNISWEQKSSYTKATFTLNGQILYAYYNNNGDLQAVVRNIISDQLPITLLTDLRKDYNGYWITDLFEISSDNETTYYVTLENSDKKIVLKSSGAAYWDVFSKEKKESI